MKIFSFFPLLLTCFYVVATAAAQPFTLTDSGIAAPDFRQRFLGSYGINAAIEPEITQAERPLYERVAPYLRDDPRRAIRAVEAAIGPATNAAFDFLLGNLHYQLGQYGQSERALQQAVSKFPTFRRAHRTLGLIHIQSGRFEAAVETWLRVITLGGGDAQSYGLLGYAYLTQEKYQSALTAYQHARMFKPDSTDFRRGEAQCLLQTGQLRQAAALFDELIAENPAVADYWLLQANTYLGLERYDDAMANLQILAANGQASWQSRMLLGDLYLRDDNHRLALQSYQDALQAHGVAAVADSLRPLEYLIGRSLFDEAAAYLETLKTVLPAELEPADQARLTIAEAGLALERDSVEPAIALLAPLVEARPLEGDALLLLAEAHRRGAAWEQAEFYLQRARSIPAKEVAARIALGRLAVDRGDFDAALGHLRAARQLEPRRTGLAAYIEAVEAAR